MRRIFCFAPLIFALLTQPSFAAAGPCRPFRIHLAVNLPAAPPEFDPEKQNEEWEKATLEALSKLPGQGSLREYYLRARQSRAQLGGEESARRWLHCASHYLAMDTDGDGVQDWTSLVDRSPAKVLIPLDEDMDGDGVENVLDPAPTDPTVKGAKLSAGQLPKHLLLSGDSDLPALQTELYKEFGIIAVEHTDKHSPVVLRELLFLMRSGLPISARHFRNFRVLYAFAGHDPRVDIAAFHAESHAISIGGMRSYGVRPLSPRDRVHVLASLAHELGHAMVFERLTVGELREAGERFGNWKSVFGDRPIESLYDRVFFSPNPLRGVGSTELGEHAALREHNVTSSYALKNVHEWFADGFAGYVLNRIGLSKLLGNEWRALLARGPAALSGGWVDYNNITPQFQAWLDARLSPSPIP